LYNKELQDSYGVTKPEDLLMEMIDNPVEYNNLLMFIQNNSEDSQSFDELVDEAKN
jgi:hypothetical protein